VVLTKPEGPGEGVTWVGESRRGKASSLLDCELTIRLGKPTEKDTETERVDRCEKKREGRTERQGHLELRDIKRQKRNSLKGKKPEKRRTTVGG